MAMWRKTLERIDIRRNWTGAISDYAQMTRALKEAGYPVLSPRQGLLLSPVAMSWSEALSFGRSQCRITWLHDPGLWALAALGPMVPIAGASAALNMALHGSVFGINLVACSLMLGEIRYRCRRRIVCPLWGESVAAGLAIYWRVKRWLRPIWLSFHALCVLSAPGARHIRWAGKDYLVRGLQNVEVIRPPAA